MPIITMPVDKFIPKPALANQMVRLFRINAPTQLNDVQVVVAPAGSIVTTGTITGTKANVATTAAKHATLVANLNSGNKVVITLTTDNSNPTQVRDFESAVVVGAPASGPLALADEVPNLPPGEFLGEGSSSDSAIPV